MISVAISKIAQEAPFRIFARQLVKLLPFSASTKSRWDIGTHPQYLFGLVTAAQQALEEGQKKIIALEFGVAGGNGLVALEKAALQVEKEFNIEIDVFGFDTGTGLPEMLPDHRDHPDEWAPADFPMDVDKLKARLQGKAQLVLGNLTDTVAPFMAKLNNPIGFISFDVDLYSSTTQAFQIFTHSNYQALLHTPLYFDDCSYFKKHPWGGELLAMQEFNNSQSEIKISPWTGVAAWRPFPNAFWLKGIYVAHYLKKISQTKLSRSTDRSLDLK